MSDDLHVVTARLYELADAQQRAADQLTAVTVMTASTPPAVAVSHGTAASATAAALAAVQAARTEAGVRVAAVSLGLGTRLGEAALQYDRADRASGSELDQQIPGLPR